MPATGRRSLAGVALVLVSCTAVQGSAALAVPLFDTLHPAVAAAWRQVFGALVLVTLLRPRVRGRDRAEWLAIAVLGGAIASMNVLFYLAADRLPLGIAATLLYLGPFAVAAVHTGRDWRLLLPLSALAGVVLVSRPGAGADLTGTCLGLLAAGSLAAYTLTSQRLGRDGGLDRLALAAVASALVLSPLSLSSIGTPGPGQWLTLAVSGAVGIGVAFSCDFVALRLVGTRVVATLFALDPVVGALVGAVALSQQLDVRTIVGIVVIVVAGGVTTALREGPGRAAYGPGRARLGEHLSSG